MSTPTASSQTSLDNDANNNSSSQKSSRSSRWLNSSSSSDSTEQEGLTFPRFILDPDSSVVCYWTAVVALATLYNAWTIALRISFPEIRQETAPSYLPVLDMLSDVIYVLDILVQLRIAYLQDGIPVFEPLEIRHHYVSQTYFIEDIIAILPSQSILSFLPDAVGCCKYFLCTAGAARLTKLLKFHVLYKFYDIAESFTSNPHLIRVLRLFLNLAIIIHWIACLYYLLSEYEGLGSNAWVYTDAEDQQRFSRKYIICLYWSAMTLTTIGNTNAPETDIEYIFTGLIFMTGVFVFATVMGNVGDVISSMNANRQEFQARMDHIQMYLMHKKVPASLQIKIKKWAEYTWSRTKATDESRLLNMLPERLRAEVAVHVHLDSLKKVKIFEQCETGFLCELVLKLRSQVYSPGDYVCRAGETGREMFIINHGKVEVIVPNPATNKPMVVAVLSEGNYFGEISLLRLDGVQNRRTADVRSIGYSELLCLSRRDLMSALVEYPEAKTVLEDQAKKRMKTSLQAQRAFSVDTLMRNSQDHSSPDSALGSRDETRGHEVLEIKAMIQELKNANKVPGKTVWQLIARCEVLQAKLNEKDKEVEDSKQRIKDLEQLLYSRHVVNCHDGTEESESIADSNLETSERFLRAGGRIMKQYSHDEGRVPLATSVSSLPSVQISQPFSEKSVVDKSNFIKTSKIRNIFEKCPENGDKKEIETIEYKTVSDDEKQVLQNVVDVMKSGVKKVDTGFKITQNIWNCPASFDYCVSNETSIDHTLYFDENDELTFSSSYKEEIRLSDTYSFDVHTIPEESEEDMLKINDAVDKDARKDKNHDKEFVNSKAISNSEEFISNNSSETPLVAETLKSASNDSKTLDTIKNTKNKDCYTLTDKIRQAARHADGRLSLDDTSSVQEPSIQKVSISDGLKRLQSISKKIPYDSSDSCSDVDFRRMGSSTRYYSDDTDPRKNSWGWETDCDSEEEYASN